MSGMNPSVTGFIRKSKEWQDELNALRAILLDAPLVEEVKWRVPCYTFDGANVAFVGRFKNACVLSFVKGALLKDPAKILVQQTSNSQSVRIVRFANVREIAVREATLRAYLREAIDAERAGMKVKFKATVDFERPAEFEAELARQPDLADAFDALTPGRQRAYLLHFAGAKQSKTRAARVAKWTPHILAGQGIDD